MKGFNRDFFFLRQSFPTTPLFQQAQLSHFSRWKGLNSHTFPAERVYPNFPVRGLNIHTLNKGCHGRWKAQLFPHMWAHSSYPLFPESRSKTSLVAKYVKITQEICLWSLENIHDVTQKYTILPAFILVLAASKLSRVGSGATDYPLYGLKSPLQSDFVFCSLLQIFCLYFFACLTKLMRHQNSRFLNVGVLGNMLHPWCFTQDHLETQNIIQMCLVIQSAPKIAAQWRR